jgi:hypothetical protein
MNSNQILNSLPQNKLGLYNESGEVLIDNTCEFLELSKAELASALGVSYDQIRQARLTGKARDRVEQLASALGYVADAFDGDLKKTLFWIRTPNLNFGGLSPRQLIIRGKYKKVIDFIISARAT